MFIQELLLLTEASNAQDADKIFRRLLAHAHNDVSDSDQKLIKLDIARRLEQGWLADEIVDYARHQEAIQPDLDEDKALARMNTVKNRVKERLASVNENVQLDEKVFDEDQYTWYVWTQRKPSQAFERRGGAKSLEKGMQFGLRPATSKKGAWRLVIKQKGPSIIFSIDDATAKAVAKASLELK